METLTRLLVALFLRDDDHQECCIRLHRMLHQNTEHCLITVIQATQAIDLALLSGSGLGFAKQDPHECLAS